MLDILISGLVLKWVLHFVDCFCDKYPENLCYYRLVVLMRMMQ